jgi:hypothetical protein
MPGRPSREEAEREQAARERGRSIPHYAGKVTKELAKPRKKRAGPTPSKRG